MTNVTTTTDPLPPVQRCNEPRCRTEFEISRQLLACELCGGLLDIVSDDSLVCDPIALRERWKARRASIAACDLSGVWRFRELLPFPEDTGIVSLREGNTPIYEAPLAARDSSLDSVLFKHQGQNPTGSFKDTGMTTAITQARRLGARYVVCASTGNTAASLAAYAARANLRCVILVPSSNVSSGKLAQSLDYGATVFEIAGNFDDAMRVAMELFRDESVYLVNSINPFRIEGQKTTAFELLEQLSWEVPDHVVVPGGNLGNASALGKGFAEALALGLITRMPRLSVVQAEGASPFARLFAEHDAGKLLDPDLPADLLVPTRSPRTLATAIKIGEPLSWRKALRAVLNTGGCVLSVSEGEIADAKAIIGRDGIGCEPASAAALAGIKRLARDGRIGRYDRVVGILTGHVLKDTDYTLGYHSGTLRFEHEAEAAETERGPSQRFRNRPISAPPSSAAILAWLARDEKDRNEGGELP